MIMEEKYISYIYDEPYDVPAPPPRANRHNVKPKPAVRAIPKTQQKGKSYAIVKIKSLNEVSNDLIVVIFC